MPKKSEIFKENLLKQLRPQASLWSLFGIVIFFFVPEIVAFFWGDKIVAFSDMMQKRTDDYVYQKLYESLKMFGENSTFNIILGFLFLFWWIYERKRV